MKIRMSLRWQLQLYYFAILSVTLIILTGLTIHWMRESELNKYDSRLRDLQRFIIPLMAGPYPGAEDLFIKQPESVFRPQYPGSPPHPHSGNHHSTDRKQGPHQQGGKPHLIVRNTLKEGWYFASWSKNGRLVAASLNYPDHAKPDIRLDFNEEAVIRDYQGYRQLVSRSMHMTSIVIAYPRELLDAAANRRAWIIIGFSTLLLLVSTFIGWLLIGRALRPLHSIQNTANEISKGQLSERITPTTVHNEIGELAENLNQTFSQLETMFERQARFSSDASHELRTPISVILNHCQHGLSRERSTEEYRDTLNACLRAGERMKSLTTNLLELSRLESGEVQLERSPCSLGEIAEEALELVEHLAGEKGITLKGEIEDVTIHANGDRIWQVIVNLLNNAIRHTPAEKSVILRTEKIGQQAKISVIDEGEGIPAESIPHLFDRFYRVDPSRVRSQKEGGFGLGLAICDTIIKAHQGTIQVESTPGIKTQFIIFLPA